MLVMLALPFAPVDVDDFGLSDVVAFTDRCVAWLAGFDAESWSALQAKDAVEAFARAGRVMQAALAVAAGRVAATGAWASGGDRSPAAYLARVSGTTTGQADETLVAVRRLEGLSATNDALRAGELSLEQAAAVTQAATADPASERRLLDTAASSSVGELKKQARDVVVHADQSEDPVERRHRTRHFRVFAGEDAMRAYAGELPPAMAGEVESVWNEFTKQAFLAARTEGRRESEGAYMADGLLAMARAAAAYRKTSREQAPAIRPHFVFRIDLAPMLRGQVHVGEVCEIPGVGPIDVATARRYLPNAILDFVVHDGIDVKAVAHAKRKARRSQLAALLSRDYVCEVEGCDCRRFLEIDHITPYADSRRTSVEELGYKCRHSHHLKTHKGWTDGPLQPDGTRKLIPPPTPPPHDSG